MTPGSASLTGMLTCSTTGLGGVLGVVAELVAGSLAGWQVAMRAAHV